MAQTTNSGQELTPLWRLGFRPFFLFSAIFAAIGIVLWLLVFLGAMHPVGSFDPILLHAHEMIYGYATAVIAGFVLTASQNWTERPGLKGTPLKFLFLLWVLGRGLMSVTQTPSPVIAAIDLSFYPALGIAMFPYLRPADMKVERVFFLFFALYFTGNLLMHLERLGIVSGYGLRGALLGLNTTILMIVFMGGRLIPFFTESEKAKAQPRTHALVEVSSHATAVAFLVTQFFIQNSRIAAITAFAACLIHLIRLSGWYVRRVRRVALLWVLYSSYFWIALGFGLFGFTSLGLIALGPAVHALTIGGLGLMTYGMMSRVSLGHTGRKLKPVRPVIEGFVLLNLACLSRVFGPILDVLHLKAWIFLSGTLWVTAFAVFLYVYAPMLIRARVDGRSG